LDIFLFSLYVISLVVMADTKLKEFPAGQQFLNGLENGTISIIQWRAQSDPNMDMIGIKKILLITTIILFILAFIMMSNGTKINTFFSSIFLVNSLLFLSVQWFLDIKNETLKMVGFMIVMVASPWILHFLGGLAGINTNLLDTFRNILTPLGFSHSSDYELLAQLSLISLLGSAIILGLWIMMLAIPSIILLWSIKLINRIFILLVNVERQKVQLFFVAVNILVPIWFFAKDRMT